MLFQSCLPFALLARYSIIRCKDCCPQGSLMMFIEVHSGESGRSLLQPQRETEEPRRCAIRSGTVQNLKGKKDKIKQETGYTNIVCQLRSLKKVTVRDNVSWLYCVWIQTLMPTTFLLVTHEDKGLPEGPRISPQIWSLFFRESELRNSKPNHRSS